VAGISDQRHRITGVAEDTFDNHESSIEADTDCESASEIRWRWYVTTRPVGMVMIVRPGLVGMVVVMIVRRNCKILLKSEISGGNNLGCGPTDP